MHSRKVMIITTVALWACLFCFVWLQYRPNAAVLPPAGVRLHVFFAWDSGDPHPVSLRQEVRRKYRRFARDCICISSGWASSSPVFFRKTSARAHGANTGLLVMVMGFGVIGSALWVVVLAMRALRAHGNRSEGKPDA